MLANCVQVILASLDAKDNGLLPHSLKTAQVAVSIGEKVRELSKMKLEEIYVAGLVHDIGKLYVPEAILRKNDTLTVEDKEIIRAHSFWGHKYLTQVNCLAGYAHVALRHHEMPDGSGYPQGLMLEDIQPLVRVINIADRFAALVEDRSYRRAVPVDAAVKILEGDIHKFFCDAEASKIVEVLLKSESEFDNKIPGLKKFIHRG